MADRAERTRREEVKGERERKTKHGTDGKAGKKTKQSRKWNKKVKQSDYGGTGLTVAYF